MTTRSQSQTDFSARDASAQLSTSVMITRKDSVPLKVFYDYWGDVHGVLAARGEGVANYWQHRLGAVLETFFPLPAAIDQSAPRGDPIIGLAEIGFESPAGRDALIASAVIGQMVMDEQNVLKGTYMYSTGPGNAVTVLDRLASSTPQGAPAGASVMAFIRQAWGTSAEQFRHLMRHQFAPALTRVDGVMKVRVHLLEAYDSSAWPTPNVDHQRRTDQQYQAYIELAFEDDTAASAFSASNTLASLAGDLQANVSAITTYTSFHKNTMVHGGRPTFAGLRGVSAQQVLIAIGDPANQKELTMLKLIFGDAVLQPV